MNKEINLPSGNYLFVEVPNDAYDFKIGEAFGDKAIWYEFHPNLNRAIISISTNNDCQIISTTNDIIEEKCEKLIEGGFCSTNGCMLYEDYISENSTFQTAKESLQSLIQANNLNIENNYLIIQKL